MSAQNKTVRIGGAGGFWGDSMVGAPQLVRSGKIDYLVFDYLAETTMAILSAMRRKQPELGYATDFVEIAMKPLLRDIAARGIKVLANAGGINPQACKRALEAVLQEQGVALKVAVVEGDDVLPLVPALARDGLQDMFSGAALPETLLSANAYLGAQPIREALAAGADIVITGRCVDSALVLAPLMHEFGWQVTDYDLLSAGCLAGHIIECGCQATGGLHTDWEDVPDWDTIGYPIIECAANGSFVVTKAENTGGLISRAALAEQLLYEIGDPAAYLLPDVTCDWRDVEIISESATRAIISGARGRAPGDRYKVSATLLDGFRCAGTMVIVGIDAARKAERTGQAILARTRAIFRELGLRDYSATHIEVLGAETLYGPHSRARDAREVMLRVVANHPQRQALEIFAREIAPSGTSWAPGTTSPGGGRPAVSPLVRQMAFLLPKESVVPSVMLGERQWTVESAPLKQSNEAAAFSGVAATAHPEIQTEPMASAEARDLVSGRVLDLAWARSGDKGNLSNIGVIARKPEYLPLLQAQLSCEAVGKYFAHLVKGKVTRHAVPGIGGINFLLEDALDGGGPASMRLDPLGKGMAQMLLDMPILVPAEALDRSRNARQQ